MLQSVIARMAGNQFTLRTWSVGLGAAVIGFAASKDGNLKAALLAAFPATIFWILDSYYLALEREFRDLFETACGVTDNHPDFSFATNLTRADLFKASTRPAVWLVHLSVIILAAATGGSAWIR